MNYFNTIMPFFIVPSIEVCEEFEKIDKFLLILNKSGIGKVSCEVMLMCLGRNIRKFFVLLDTKNIKSNYWEKSDDLKSEKIPFPKQKNKKKKNV